MEGNGGGLLTICQVLKMLRYLKGISNNPCLQNVEIALRINDHNTSPKGQCLTTTTYKIRPAVDFLIKQSNTL